MSEMELGQTLEQDPAPVDAASASSNGQGDDGVYYLPNGKVRFVVDGKPYTLRTPKVGEFRELHTQWVEGSGLPVTEQLEHQLVWVKLMFNGDERENRPGLSDHKLNDDADEWPTWLGAATYQSKVMVHFRDIPLAPGGQADQ